MRKPSSSESPAAATSVRRALRPTVVASPHGRESRFIEAECSALLGQRDLGQQLVGLGLDAELAGLGFVGKLPGRLVVAALVELLGLGEELLAPIRRRGRDNWCRGGLSGAAGKVDGVVVPWLSWRAQSMPGNGGSDAGLSAGAVRAGDGPDVGPLRSYAQPRSTAGSDRGCDLSQRSAIEPIRLGESWPGRGSIALRQQVVGLTLKFEPGRLGARLRRRGDRLLLGLGHRDLVKYRLGPIGRQSRAPRSSAGPGGPWPPPRRACPPSINCRDSCDENVVDSLARLVSRRRVADLVATAQRPGRGRDLVGIVLEDAVGRVPTP